MNVRVKNDEEGEDIPEGSVIKVTRETIDHYFGIYASAAGTYKVKVKKANCEANYVPLWERINLKK